jgi:hypothetical protein
MSSARARRVRAAHVLMMAPLGTVEPTRDLMPPYPRHHTAQETRRRDVLILHR